MVKDEGADAGFGLLLRYSGTLHNDQWFEIVLKGQLKQAGMVSFDKDLSHDDAAAIRAYVTFRANQSLAEQRPIAEKNKDQ